MVPGLTRFILVYRETQPSLCRPIFLSTSEEDFHFLVALVVHIQNSPRISPSYRLSHFRVTGIRSPTPPCGL